MAVAAKPILISGAGLGGLLLARSLRSSNNPFLIYERDASVTARAQGYRIRISTDGLTALQQVLTEEQFQHFKTGTSQTGGGGIHTLDAITAQALETPSNELSDSSSQKTDKSSQPTPGSKTPSLGGDVLGVARGWLRSCLLAGLEDTIHFNKKTTGYTFSSDASSVRLDFSDGTSSPEGAMLVAADGPQSTIARQLTDGKVRAWDTGARMIHGQTHSSAFRQLGVGVWSVRDTEREGNSLGLITNVRPGEEDKDVEFGWVFAGGPGTFEPPNGNFSIVGKVAADLSRDLTGKWNELFQPIFQKQNDQEAAFLKMSTAHPDGIPKWKNEPRVTLLGDSVHCMTPAGGVGANTALKDAALIGGLLKEAGGWRNDIAETYEDKMRVYASENVKMSFEAAASRFNITELK